MCWVNLLFPHLPASLYMPAWLQARALLVGFNGLTGPAFPPTWLQVGGMPRLEGLSLSHNALTGTLPANLTWPKLTFL